MGSNQFITHFLVLTKKQIITPPFFFYKIITHLSGYWIAETLHTYIYYEEVRKPLCSTKILKEKTKLYYIDHRLIAPTLLWEKCKLPNWTPNKLLEFVHLSKKKKLLEFGLNIYFLKTWFKTILCLFSKKKNNFVFN